MSNLVIPCCALGAFLVQAHGHGHSHDHSHDHQTIDYSDIDSLFPAHLDRSNINIQIVLYLCKITKAHLFIQKFDELMQPLPKTA